MPNTINEVDFCAQVSSALNEILHGDPANYQFEDTRVEGHGEKNKQRRKDLRFFGKDGRLSLCGEVKIPGTRDGKSALDESLMQNAFLKAEEARVQYFFTWNVNEFALFDRSRWDKPLLERRVYRKTLGRYLKNREDVAREDNLRFIKTCFLPDLLRDLSDFVSGRRQDWLFPDELFIQILESRLDWPVRQLTEYILNESAHKTFDLKAQQWMTSQDRSFVRTPHEEWAKSVENMAKTLSYVWANRIIFYKALRSRFPELPRLDLPKSIREPKLAIEKLNLCFAKAVEVTHDYESLLMPNVRDWGANLAFQGEYAIDAWRSLLKALEDVDFREVPSDVVGRIFQKLIGPDERHRYGQHFTGDDVVDLINTFCIRDANAAVLDPACGSGSFLVRAYYRKKLLDPSITHMSLISELYGCDISVYPAHLATLNLAAREINDEANYPRITRSDFFDVAPEEAFMSLPDGAGGQTKIIIPKLGAVVANPPYVRQEKIEKSDKAKYSKIASEGGVTLSGRSDIHCYFWPAAARFLKHDGYFGFLTSSSWLDVEYGFALQGWILKNFRILAIMESGAEPWFEDARVKTCAAILQRCESQDLRNVNRVRFVRFNRELSEIIGVPPGENDSKRMQAYEELRNAILATDHDVTMEDYRIIVKKQEDLWNDGVRTGRVIDKVIVEDEDDEEESTNGEINEITFRANGEYVAGKWGRYLRAPEVYFEIMRRFGPRFVSLGSIADIRFGVKSGCDDFFMPRDVTQSKLDEFQTDKEFRQNAGGAPRKDVESGKLKIIEAGDGSIHPIESKYVAPEVHSLMKIDTTTIRAKGLDRLVLLVGLPINSLERNSPWTFRYLNYGAKATFASNKSRAVPIPERASCSSRDRWYDLTGLVKPGFAFWSKSQQYRHIVAANPERLICNCNLYDLGAADLNEVEVESLSAILNSTVVGLFKTFYGRYAGTEGNLKTEVVDVKLLEVPDPRGISKALSKKLSRALKRMSVRSIGRLVEEQLMDCHSPERARRIAAGPLVLSKELQEEDRKDLDDAVLELIGVTDPNERQELRRRLYEATAQHFREIRVVEIEKMEQRSKSNMHDRFNIRDLAADIWDAVELEDLRNLAEWLKNIPECDSIIHIPPERPVYLSGNPLFDGFTLYFGRKKEGSVECKSQGQAELVTRLAELGVKEEISVPSNEQDCHKVLSLLNERMSRASERFVELAESRTSDGRVQKQVVELLSRWIVLGRSS